MQRSVFFSYFQCDPKCSLLANTEQRPMGRLTAGLVGSYWSAGVVSHAARRWNEIRMCDECQLSLLRHIVDSLRCFQVLRAVCYLLIMREIVHIQAGQCGNQIGTKVGNLRRLH